MSKEIIQEIRDQIEKERKNKMRKALQNQCGYYDSLWCVLYKAPCNGQCE